MAFCKSLVISDYGVYWVTLDFVAGACFDASDPSVASIYVTDPAVMQRDLMETSRNDRLDNATYIHTYAQVFRADG